MTSFFRFASKRATYLDDNISLAYTRCTHLSQVIKPQNKIIYTVLLLTFKTPIFTENNQHIQN